MVLTRRAGEDGRPAHASPSLRDQLAKMRADLGRDRVLLRDRELAAVPRVTGPLERRRHDLREGLLEAEHGEGLVDVAETARGSFSSIAAISVSRRSLGSSSATDVASSITRAASPILQPSRIRSRSHSTRCTSISL